ncbi:phosphatase 2C-like domain-containing protein [Crucibulum laeve]|uniref:Phosphatase 2C-like domain-containing protein n=1 Tax=Crucibulum laeve TaxID=68775 RepID=A0A5C3LRR4_9AGAR|nr:phosphatase 2C-like domain-containing protein [Crucibulum laeve]
MMFRHFSRRFAYSCIHARTFDNRTRLFLGTTLTTAIYGLYTLNTIHADEETPSKPARKWTDPDAGLTVSTLDELLHKHETSFIPDEGRGIARQDATAILPKPGTLYLRAMFYPLPSHCWGTFGILTSNPAPLTPPSGPYPERISNAAAHVLSHNLNAAIVGRLADLFSSHVPIPSFYADRLAYGEGIGGNGGARPYPPPEEIDNAIKEAFLAVDAMIVKEPVDNILNSKHSKPITKATAVNTLNAGYASAGAIFGFFESDTRVLKIALTGDSRAVLGRRIPINSKAKHGKEEFEFDVEVLTTEQTASNPSERARLIEEHPGESSTLFSSFFRPLSSPTRAFATGPLKWPRSIQERLHADFLGDPPPPATQYLSPPYLTAEPVITTVEVRPGDFLVLGNAALFKQLSNEEVIGLTGAWLNVNKRRVYTTPENAYLSSTSSEPVSASFTPAVQPYQPLLERSDLPVNPRFRAGLSWFKSKSPPKSTQDSQKFLNVDTNAATHLVRNALAGADRDLLEALLRTPEPRTKKLWDDIGVHVIFFQ